MSLGCQDKLGFP
jgi:hypothetical protein